jgi:hypothetical protein
MDDKKSIKLIVEKLFSNKTDEVLFAINRIRNSGQTSVLPHVIELLNSEKNSNISGAIIELLNDLKNQEGTTEIIKAIKNKSYQSIQKILLISCWQSGLDYSGYLDYFIELFISEDFEIAFEAFTIIENMDENISHEIIDPLVRKLKNEVSKSDGSKIELMIELVGILEKRSKIAE